MEVHLDLGFRRSRPLLLAQFQDLDDLVANHFPVNELPRHPYDDAQGLTQMSRHHRTC